MLKISNDLLYNSMRIGEVGGKFKYLLKKIKNKIFIIHSIFY